MKNMYLIESISDINTSELKIPNQQPTSQTQNYGNVYIKPEFQEVQILQMYNSLPAMY